MTNKPTLYFDLDGVFADFFGEFAKKCNITSYKEYGQNFKVFLEYCEKHIHGTDFFLNLPKFKSTDKILVAAKEQFDDFCILSSPLAGDELNTEILKKEWCKQNLHIKPKEVIISKTKINYAEGNILIDDFTPNLKKWVEAGGIAIKYKANSLNYSEQDLIDAFEFIRNDILINGFKPKEVLLHKNDDFLKFLDLKYNFNTGKEKELSL